MPHDRLNAAAAYLERCGCRRLSATRYNAVLLHYEGNTSQSKKNLDHGTAGLFLRWVLEQGYVPIVLDWDRRSPHPDQKRIFCPGVGPGDLWGNFGSGDAASLAALIERSALFVGVDSGPQKAAAATGTPAIGIWTGHHPVQFFDPAPNFIHLVKEPHRLIPPADNGGVAAYFESNYRFSQYRENNLLTSLYWQAGKFLGVSGMETPAKLCGFATEPTREDMDWVIIQDVFVNDCYRLGLLGGDLHQPRVMVDVGAHVGAFAKLWHQRYPQSRVFCIEACEENYDLLRRNVGGFATIVGRAMTYEKDVWLLNSVTGSQPLTTGGSRVVGRDEFDREHALEYGKEEKRLATVTLDELMHQYDIQTIDLLKLDCEGSEFSILEHAPIDRIRLIVGEYHGLRRWEEFRQRRFPASQWSYGHMTAEGEFGIFHLRNEAFQRDVQP
jgi:FkbM family methyltransferase